MLLATPDRSPADARADLAACRALLRGGSRTFYAASHVLPTRVREPAIALYAFCRLADDAVDLHTGPDATQALAGLHRRLARLYEGRPLPHAADRAFAEVVTRFAIPRALPEALLEGFAWDARGKRYETLADLHDYAARVAGAVGAMMALLMGARAPALVARACDLGVAMQLTNIARDVGEDAQAGRLYLPRAWLREAGVDPDAWLARPTFTPALGGVVQRLLAAADELYVRAADGIAQLPAACRPGMHAARLIYAEIGREVERRGLDSVSRRAVVSGARKARLLAGAIAVAALPGAAAAAPPLEATQYLVEAVAQAPAPSLDLQLGPPWWNLHARVIWTLALFERLERQQQQQAYGRGSASG
jgi:phytoene synthase